MQAITFYIRGSEERASVPVIVAAFSMLLRSFRRTWRDIQEHRCSGQEHEATVIIIERIVEAAHAA